MDQELFDIAIQNAVRDSEATGDRFVPMGTFDGFWAVLDAKDQSIISRGLSFETALNDAQILSDNEREFIVKDNTKSPT